MTPWESCPARLAPTSESATKLAMSVGVPAASKIAEAVLVRLSADKVSIIPSNAAAS
jgi:hypothetical protein